MVTQLRPLSRHVNRLAAVLLIVPGGFIVYHWGWALATDVSMTTSYGPIGFLERQSTWRTITIHNNRNAIAVVGAVALVTSPEPGLEPGRLAELIDSRRSPLFSALGGPEQ